MTHLKSAHHIGSPESVKSLVGIKSRPHPPSFHRLTRTAVSSLVTGTVLLLSSCGSDQTAILSPSSPEPATTAATSFNWKGHTWRVTSGGMAGVAQGNPSNVFVDANGYLHLRITNSGGVWTAAELFSTDLMGFGTYQWQIDGPVDRLDKNIVVGLFPYGPAAGIGVSGTNEIDIEFARWGNSAWPNGNYTVYPGSGSTVGSSTFNFTLGSTYTTSTFTWSSGKIDFMVQEGLKAVGDNSGIIRSWTYAPANPTTNIPQRAMPLGMNLWCFGAPPSNGQNAEIIIRDFKFIPQGTPPVTQHTITASAGAGGSISPAGSVSVNQGASQSFTIAPAAGYRISGVTVDGVNQGAISSYTFSNVQAGHSISAGFVSSTGQNLALGKAASASALEAASYAAGNAVDGSGSTRYSSPFADPQWILIDLGAAVAFNRVVLKWEAAYGKAYQIQTSNDKINWSTVYSRTNGVGGTEDFSFATATARYIRLYGTQRGTAWGYSLWEFEVYNSNITPPTTQYTITASVGAGGGITPSGSVRVNQGAGQSFTITPAAGYRISDVSVDGVSQGAISSYSFSNVQAGHTISASFTALTAPTNIAPAGIGYIWARNTSETSNLNRSAKTGVNDNNLAVSINCNPAGEGGAARWEGAGVVWSTARTVSSVTFVNGAPDAYGNCYFQANCRLQFSTDGSTWSSAGWTLSPAYPYSDAAAQKAYTFTGASRSGIRGVRVVGQTGAQSWSWTVNEVQVFDR